MRGIVFLVCLCGCTTAWYSAWRAQQDQVDALRPAAPAPSPHVSASRRRVLVRIWVDEDYRSQNINWQERVRKLIERAGDAIGPWGAELEIASIAEWSRRSVASLHTDADALFAHDRGESVDLVLGFVSALPAFETSVHNLGVARLLGKHIVLRGAEDASEYEAITSSWMMLSAEKKTELYYQRKRHKETSVFAHEWGHTLGALHTDMTDDFMRPSWSAEESGFSPDNAEIIALGLSHPERHTPDGRAAWYRALTELLERQASAGGPNAERDELLARLRDSGPPPPKPRAPPAERVEASAVVLVPEEERPAPGCEVLGMQRVDASDDWARAEAAMKEVAAKAGGDKVAVLRKEKGGKRYLLGTVWRCR